MFSQKLLLPAFAVFSVATAQSSLCAASTATITINAQADVTQIADCSTVAGSVLIGTGVVGNIDLSGPDTISGSLICSSAPLLNLIKSSTLGSVATSKGASFNLFNMTGLNTIEMPSLTQVGTIYWSALNALSTLTFTSTIKKATNITITNTFLSDIPGLNLTTVGLLDINNNRRLNSFTTTVETISSGLNVASNGQNLDIRFPSLVWANDAVFRNVTAISFPSLETVNGSLIFDENHFTEVLAPNLTTVGDTGNGKGSLAYVGNNKLTNITIPGLISIGGGLQVANNSALQDISFPQLVTVGGAIDLSGNFSTPSLPVLNNVVGALNVQSTSDINCDNFNKLKGNVVQGEVNCVSKTSDPEALNPSSTGTGSASSPTKSKGAAPSFGVSEAAAGLSVVGGILQMLL